VETPRPQRITAPPRTRSRRSPPMADSEDASASRPEPSCWVCPCRICLRSLGFSYGSGDVKARKETRASEEDLVSTVAGGRSI
jgi:hypothetical protein